MIETERDAKEMQKALLAKGVAIGRPFQSLETMIRVSNGTDAEMAEFRNAFLGVMAA
jgi:histidinol-phosphate/aromatic aminotransferase/cobyric acid decarboxylase-like protein